MSESDTDDSESITLDQQFASVKDPTRRRILTALAEQNPRTEAPLEVDDFHCERLAVNRIETRLYHVHLPHLAASGFICWDREADTITRGPNFEKVRPLLQRLSDNRDEVTDYRL